MTMFGFKLCTLPLLMNLTWEDTGEVQWYLSYIDINQVELNGHFLLLHFKKASTTRTSVLARGHVLGGSQLWSHGAWAHS